MTMLAILALALGTMVMPAQAITAIDFNIDGVTGNHGTLGGSIDYSTLGGALVGSNIEVDTVGDPNNSVPQLTITNGNLSFTTGNLTSTTANQWIFGGGGPIVITGDVDFGSGLQTGVTLLSGTMQNATVLAVGGSFLVSVATFFDTKDERLLTYFGLAPGFIGPFPGYFNISFIAEGLPPDTFASTTVLSGDVVNTVPIPPTALLLGGGLFGLVALGWRRRKKA